MQTAPVTDLKNRLSHFLRLVARGETVTVLDRGRPIARITRVEAGDAELEALVGTGIVRAPLSPVSRGFFSRKLPTPSAPVSHALRDDREDRF